MRIYVAKASLISEYRESVEGVLQSMTQITPFLYCADLDAEVAFFESLGFVIGSVMRDPDYAFMRRDQVAVRLIKIGDDLELSNFAHQMVYVDVDDVDALYSELKPVLDMLPKGRVTAPFDRIYGQREFHVSDEGPYMLMFGTSLQKEGSINR